MATHAVTLTIEPDRYTVQLDGLTVPTREPVRDLEHAVRLVELLARAEQNDPAAKRTLDGLGVQPPILELDPAPIA